SLRALGGEEPAPAVVVADESVDKSVLTRPMREGIAASLAAPGRTIVFLNRRGYASLLFCPRCGFIPRCGKCGSVLSYHKKIDRLVCHACGTEEKRPGACPSCGQPVLEPRGGGVEALEEELKNAFPGARIAVFDLDRAGRAKDRAKILESWGRGRIDILIGTQLLTRVPDLPPADFVGIFNPEAALAIPDFTASERTFQLLVRMIRFARPGGRRPAAVIQTGFPDHHGIRTAARLDFEAFFTEEIELRRLLGQPPFAALADIVLCGRDARLLGRRSRELAGRWTKSRAKIEVLGPSFVSEAGRPGIRRVQLELRAETAAAISGVLAAGLKDVGLPYTVVRYDGLTG
ncbi:MAG: primosomal protein N', partial [Candidatus Aminicenantales bacterium]